MTMLLLERSRHRYPRKTQRVDRGGQFVGSLCGEVEIENAIEHTQSAHMRVRYRRGRHTARERIILLMCVKSTLDFPILRRGVWAGHPQDDTT
jgi:hypothetical protein